MLPRDINLSGMDLPHVLSYLQVLREHHPVGQRVALVGAGGIGFDVAEYLTTQTSPSLDIQKWSAKWGVDHDYSDRGGLCRPLPMEQNREIFLLQRKTSKVGGGLGKTSGWVHRASLKKKGVEMLAGVTYRAIVPEGIEIEIDGEVQVLAVDHVVICAGQVPLRELEQGLLDAGQSVHRIGGAEVAAELDAKRAIRQGAELAAAI